MAVNTKNTKYFYPPRPGNGAGTFSDNIVGLQTVEGGGLTQGNFEFTTGVTEKVNRTFNVGAFSEPMTLEMMNIESLEQSRAYARLSMSTTHAQLSHTLDLYDRIFSVKELSSILPAVCVSN